MSLKDKISSPLEAGPSILDAHHLPPHLSPALEYTSSRLARRAMHITIVVVRRDFQLPAVVPPLGSPGVSPPQTPSSPGLMLKTASSVASLRQLVRAGSFSRKSSRAGDRSTSVSPTSMGNSPGSPRGGMRWPVSPVSPMSPTPRTPRTPMTPGTPSTISSSGTGTSRFLDQSAHSMRFVHAGEPSAREDKVLHQTLSKAGRKFHLGPESLPPVEQASVCGLPQSLIHASLTQNEVLFSAEGLTILALDGLYSLKSALSAYHKTKSPMRLEDAVDELRRLVLASGGRKVIKSDLLRSYDWLGISHSAISDLDRMYRRAYGGPEQIGGIAGMTTSRARQVHTYRPGTHKDTDDDADTLIGKASESSIDAASIPPAEWDKPPSPKLSQLPKIQTTFAPLPMAAVGSSFSCRTASMVTTTTTRPNDGRITMMQPWGPDSSIDNIMTAGALSPERASARLGPITPNKYDDISPITRGEWGFLMVDDAFKGVKTAAVETC